MSWVDYKQKWEVFGSRTNGKEFENMSEMNSMVLKKVVRWRRRKIGKKIEDGWLMMLEQAFMEGNNK